MEHIFQKKYKTNRCDILFNEYLPTLLLRSLVYTYWTYFGPIKSGHLKHRVLPDGCTDLMFSVRENGVEAVFVGPMLSHRIIELRSEELKIIGVRFFPGGIFRFIDHPLDELKEKNISLAAFLGNKVIDFTAKLHTHKILTSLAYIEDVLLKKLLKLKSIDSQLSAALSIMYHSKGSSSISSLGKDLAIGERQLRRICRQWTGYSPKQLLKILRFQFSLQYINRIDFHDWAGNAVEAGYSDQAHMINSFKEFTGLTPVTLVNDIKHSLSQCPIFSIPVDTSLVYL